MTDSTNRESVENNLQTALLVQETTESINSKNETRLILTNIKTTADKNKSIDSETNIETSPLIKSKVNGQKINLKQAKASEFIEQINCKNDTILDSTHIVISNENNSEENAVEEISQTNKSNSEISTNTKNVVSNNGNNITPENSLLTLQQQHMMLHLMNSLVNNQPLILNVNQQPEQKEGKLAILGDLATFLFFILYLADIWSDMSLAFYFFSVRKYESGYTVLIPVYVSSLITTIFERETRKLKSLKYHFLWGFIVFIFNLSGLLLYLEIIYMLRRKLRKKTYSKRTLESKQQTLKILKTSEACFEAYPQIYFQTKILSESVVANEHITWLQYVSIATSTLGLIFSIAGFLVTVTQNYPSISLIGKIIKHLWLFFDTVLFIVLSMTIIMPVMPSLGYYNIFFLLLLFLVYPFFNAFLYMEIAAANHLLELQRNILMIFLSTSSYFPFELKCYNSWKPILARIVLIVGVILTTIRWYYSRNEIAMNLPFTFDFINYASIICCVLGLAVVILVTVQIIRVPTVRSEYHIVHYILFFSY